MNANDKKMAMLGIIVVIIAIIGAFVSEMPFIPKETTETEIQWIEQSEEIGPFTGSLQEGGSTDEAVTIDMENLVSVSVTLTWQDEPDATNRHTNQPDTFTLTVVPPYGGSEKESSDSGTISIDIQIDENMTTEEYMGEWLITITLDNAGDQTPLFSITTVRDRADTGNSFSLDGKIIFKMEQEVEAGE